MTVIQFLRQLYSLDTLDTRFTTSSKTPLKAAASESTHKATESPPPPTGSRPGAEITPGASPSRWNTLEFYFYALVFVVCVPQMFKAVIDVSQCESPPFPRPLSLGHFTPDYADPLSSNSSQLPQIRRPPFSGLDTGPKSRTFPCSHGHQWAQELISGPKGQFGYSICWVSR